MKQILLLRHAKSSWNDPDLKDYDRPLSKRGLNDAPMMGEFARKIRYKPEHIYSSPAKRARQTSELFCEGARIDPSIISFEEDLYFKTAEAYIRCIQECSEDTERIMLVGHNPLMEEVASKLSGGDMRGGFRIPTAAMVCMETFVQRWDSTGPASCQLKWMMIPKVLKEMD